MKNAACPECGDDFPDQDDFCPHCGFAMQRPVGVVSVTTFKPPAGERGLLGHLGALWFHPRQTIRAVLDRGGWYGVLPILLALNLGSILNPGYTFGMIHRFGFSPVEALLAAAALVTLVNFVTFLLEGCVLFLGGKLLGGRGTEREAFVVNAWWYWAGSLSVFLLDLSRLGYWRGIWEGWPVERFLDLPVDRMSSPTNQAFLIATVWAFVVLFAILVESQQVPKWKATLLFVLLNAFSILEYIGVRHVFPYCFLLK